MIFFWEEVNGWHGGHKSKNAVIARSLNAVVMDFNLYPLAGSFGRFSPMSNLSFFFSSSAALASANSMLVDGNGMCHARNFFSSL